MLRWQHVEPNSAYEVWRHTEPYFDPEQGVGMLLDTVTATPGEMTRPDDGVIGNPAQNHFYVVRGFVGGGASSPSTQVGEFDFSLVPGD